MADVWMERNGVRAEVAETSVATMEGWGWARVSEPAFTAPRFAVDVSKYVGAPVLPPEPAARPEPPVARRKGRR